MFKKETKSLVPIILNGRVVSWIFDIGDPEVTIQIAMRYYIDPIGFIPQILDVHFIRKSRNIAALMSRITGKKHGYGTIVEETYYACEYPNVRFENEIVPVIK